MNYLRAAVVALFAVLAASPALGQTATAANHAFVIGKGPTVSGFTSLLCGAGQLAVAQAGADPICRTVGGDVTFSALGAVTLNTVNANVGSFGSATQCVTLTIDAKGRITAASQTACTIASIPITNVTGMGAGVLAALQVDTGLTGAFVLFNGAGGTPSSITLTNGAGLPIGTGVSGLGTGIATALGVNTGSAGAPVLFNGAGGTPSSLDLTNATNLPIGSVTGMSAGCATALTTPTSVNLRACFTDETGTGLIYFQGGDAGTPSALVGTNISGTAASLTAGNATKLATARAIGIAGSTGLTATGVNFDGTAAINPALGGTLVVASGGTNATTAAGARTSLGVSAAPTGFSVHKNGTDQTGITDSNFTIITWSTEIFDTGSNFASNTWTPPAGLITTAATLNTSGTNQALGAFFIVSIYKNGVRFKDQYLEVIAAATPISATVSIVDQANGTDAYDVRVFIDTTGATGTVGGVATQTYWTGMAFGP